MPRLAPLVAVLAAALGALAYSPSAHAASTAFADFGQLNVHGDADGASDDAITVVYDSGDDSYVVTDSDGIAPEDTSCQQLNPNQVECERIEAFSLFSVHVDGHEGDDTLKAGYGGGEWHPLDESGLVGGPGNDFIGGSPNADGIGGRDGHDLLDGAAGDDDVTGGPEAGIDAVYGGPGSDSLSDGEDDGTADGDELDGGVCAVAECAGTAVEAANDDDRISYFRGAGVVVNLTQEAGNGQPGENDRLRNFESVLTGDGADQVTGSSATNEISTEGGGDSVNVSGDPGGADSVDCGSEADTVITDADDVHLECEVAGSGAGGDGGGEPGGGPGGGATGGGESGGGAPVGVGAGGGVAIGFAIGSGAARSTASDTTGPIVVVPSSNRAIAVARSGRFGFRVGPFAENVTGVVAATARKRATRRRLKLGPRSFEAKAGQRPVVGFRLSRKGRRLLAKRRRIRMVATVTARDALGNATTRTFAFTLRASG
jgi:hypothetical protein